MMASFFSIDSMFPVFRRFLFFAVLLLLAACHKDSNDDTKVKGLSVLVYIAGDNNLSDYVNDDIRQMMEGSKKLNKESNLLLFVDRKGKLPYLMKISNGDTIRLKTYAQEQKSSDASLLADVLKWMMANYEAESYGLVLWGHADGWTIKKTRAPRRSYGEDITGGEQWMDIPDMAEAIESTQTNADGGKPLRFIFADCCCFQSVESAYELRRCADYIIASPAEIPGEGAPYQTVIPALFQKGDNFAKLAVDAYYEQDLWGYREPMTVLKTSEMENLAQATHNALTQSLEPLSIDDDNYPDVDSLIYYFERTHFDMNDFMLRHCDDNVYREWKRSFDAAVVYRTVVPVWMANYVSYTNSKEDTFLHFSITEDRCGGVSMFVPQDPEMAYLKCLEDVNWNYSSYYYASSWRNTAKIQNERISKMQWYKAAGLDTLGW